MADSSADAKSRSGGGGTLKSSAALVLCCGSNDAEIARRAQRIGREVADLRENGACGTPAEVAEKIATYRDAGAGRMYLQVLDVDDLSHLELVATEIMPLLT